MNSRTYVDVLKEAEKLPQEQRLMLVEQLIHHLRVEKTASDSAPAWEDFAGSAPYPLCGDDAQIWVSQSRRGSDDQRMVS